MSRDLLRSRAADNSAVRTRGGGEVLAALRRSMGKEEGREVTVDQLGR